MNKLDKLNITVIVVGMLVFLICCGIAIWQIAEINIMTIELLGSLW